MTDYELMCRRLAALTDGVPYLTANLANASALIFDSMDNLNWAGFYLADGNDLVLGPFQGKPACIVIPYGKGVCGAAFRDGRTYLVGNVHEFPGHIACDSASNSEIVIPLRSEGRLVGVLDIDSPVLERFTERDREGLERFASVLEESLAWK